MRKDQKEEDDVFQKLSFRVELYKPTMKMELDHKEWFDKAFGLKRNMMQVNYTFTKQEQVKQQK